MIKSSVVIAKMLKSEGFSDHVGNTVEKYWMRNIFRGNRRKVKKLDADVAEMCKKLTDAEKLILGKFIGLHKRMSFDTGLRIGLTAFARKTDKEYQLIEPDEDAGSGASAASTEHDSFVGPGPRAKSSEKGT